MSEFRLDSIMMTRANGRQGGGEGGLHVRVGANEDGRREEGGGRESSAASGSSSRLGGSRRRGLRARRSRERWSPKRRSKNG